MGAILNKLLDLLENTTGDVYIQTHDFPDPDAVATAFALHRLLKEYEIDSKILYHGFIQREALNRMINLFDIPLRHASSYFIHKEDSLIVVDGNKENRNIHPMECGVLGVIDHHQTFKMPVVPFVDIRPELGSCSSILWDYWESSPFSPDCNVSTALLIGIARDTDNFKRMVTPMDLQAFSSLWESGDSDIYYNIIRNNVESQDRIYYRQTMNLLDIREKSAFIYFEQGCPAPMMGILGDFLLSMNDIVFSFIAARNGKTINISVRNESPSCNAADFISKLLEKNGWGGGHREMAGGIVPIGETWNYESFKQRALTILQDSI